MRSPWVDNIPRTCLLYGPPGTGKTALVNAVSREAGVGMVCVSPSTLLSSWAGASERAIRRLFQQSV